MATYLELKAQLKALEQKTEEARLVELNAVIKEIRSTVRAYELTTQDIFGHHSSTHVRSRKSISPPKYRDPQTGATWSGRGRPPAWFDNENRELYLIKYE